MRVGLDAIPLATPRTGVGHYTFELARHLASVAPTDEFELVSPVPAATPIQADDEFPSNLRIVHPKVNALSRRWLAVGLPFHIRKSRFDIYHGTNYEVPVWSACPRVVTFHDLSLFLHPTTHEDRLVRRGRRRLPIMARSATRIITPSESVKREVCEHLRVSPSKVVAIPEAPRRIFRRTTFEETVEVRQRLQIEDAFILYVGTIEPRKNLVTLFRAFEEIFRSTTLRPQLVIAGRVGWLSNDFISRVKESGVGDHVRFTGYVADEDLRALYSSCRVFVYPSLYEGFGLPPLEAMACGAPVITSRIPSIVEAVGPDAARIVSPMDVQDLARNIVEVLQDEDERRMRSIRGQERASQFTWEKTARLTLDVYAEALKGSGRKQLTESI